MVPILYQVDIYIVHSYLICLYFALIFICSTVISGPFCAVKHTKNKTTYEFRKMSMKNGNWNIHISKTTTYLYLQSELFLSGRCGEIMFVIE